VHVVVFVNFDVSYIICLSMQCKSGSLSFKQHGGLIDAIHVFRGSVCFTIEGSGQGL